MAGFIDVHTHAFPDPIATRAMETLLGETDEVHAHLDGRIASLLGSMDQAGIARSVLCPIATKPSQFERILSWSREVRSERIVPFPSVHPDDPALVPHVREIRAQGFRGIKMHPYYQDFVMDEPRLFPAYEAMCEEGLILLMHTGFDVAFARVRRADPGRIVAVKERFPELKLVATHLGAWRMWDEVEAQLAGREIYMEISYSLGDLPAERARSIIFQHPENYVLFGSDSPWADQKEAIAQLRRLDLGPEREEKILRANAEDLLS